jgi:hypothetical protein
VAKSAAESVYSGLGKEGCCKVSWNLGPFRAVLVLIETVGALQMKIISTTSRAGETDVQCWPFSRSKRKSVFRVNKSMSTLIYDSSAQPFGEHRSRLRELGSNQATFALP